MGKILTIGMATYEDFDGVYFTLQNLHATQRREGVTYLVVDNAPEKCIRTESVTRAVGGMYFHRPDLVGTSRPRDAVFRLAQTPWVMCVDSHIVLETGAVEGFIRKVSESGKYDRCLIQGPIIRDDGEVLGTHWNQPAPPGLWGEWRNDGIGGNSTQEPYEIMMQGLGLFAMRKDAWPGFSYLFRGFGGEEGYIHEKVRRKGGKCISFPDLRWRHRFRDVHGGWALNPVPYPLRLEDHVWNLLVGHRELGINAVDQIYEHFGKRLPPDSWRLLVEKSTETQAIEEEFLPRRNRILAIWYSDNSAPAPLMTRSLATIQNAQQQTIRHDVDVITCSWNQVPGNPFPWTQYDRVDRVRSHLTLVKQIQQAIEVQIRFDKDKRYDAIAFLEHDVLYPENYFDRIGDSFSLYPNHNVVSNLDYIGLNQTGWLAVKERHEPMHQLSMRWQTAIENLRRAEKDAKEQGMALVEPQGRREDWVRVPPSSGLGLIPSVHVNHNKGRFTSHGEVVFQSSSGGILRHPHWGEAKFWWPGDIVVEEPKVEGCGGCGGSSPPQYSNIETWYDFAKKNPSDFHEHVQTMRDLCDKCEVVTEIGMWEKPALVAMAASKAKVIRSYAPKQKLSWPLLSKLKEGSFHTIIMNGVERKVDPTDLLFLDTHHNANTVYQQLITNKEQVRKYIVVHTTDIYGNQGDNGQPGVLWAIRKFIAENKEWTVIRNDTNNYGLIVMSRLDEDRKELPGLVRKGLNYATALKKHATSGFKITSEEEFNKRMDICLLCEYRSFDACAPCGCPLEKKLTFASEECGLVKLGLPPKWKPEIQANS